MRITTEATARGSNIQNNATNMGNIGGEYFSHYGMIGTNLFRGFEAFGENNNNNNPPPPLPEFGEGLRRSFNLLSGGNVKELDPNVAALVNALTGANLGINHVKRESNNVKPTEFGRTKAEDSNK